MQQILRSRLMGQKQALIPQRPDTLRHGGGEHSLRRLNVAMNCLSDLPCGERGERIKDEQGKSRYGPNNKKINLGLQGEIHQTFFSDIRNGYCMSIAFCQVCWE